MEKLPIIDGIARQLHIIQTVIQLLKNDLKEIVGVEEVLYVGIIFCQVCGRYPCVVGVKVTNEAKIQNFS